MKNKLLRQQGFSLIELMVVVAIIGILSAVAVPQFQKFQRKAKQAEAKSLLSAMYTAQKIFSAETGSYYTNFWAIGFEPEGLLTYDLAVRDLANVGGDLPGYTVTPYRHTQYYRSGYICSITAYADGPGKNCLSTYTNSALAASTIFPTTFNISARGDIGKGNTNGEDRWTVNQRKELTNIQNGAL